MFILIFKYLNLVSHLIVVTPTRVTESVSNIYNNDAMEKLNEKEQEIAKAKKLVLNLKNQLKVCLLVYSKFKFLQ